MPAIRTQQLVKYYSPDIRAVDGIDLAVEPGQIFGFLGQNGSGKTTTVRVLTTLLQPTSGQAEVDGLEVTRNGTAVRRRIGVALQDVALDDMQTGRELLTLQASLYGVDGGRSNERVGQLLKVVDLEDAADRLVKTYSGGMKRRLDLAAALVHGPKIVFLDEPTTGLDPISREAIWRYVAELNRDLGVTFFLTTQYLEEADRLAHNVAIIERGQIVAEGSPEALKSSIGTDVVTLKVGGGAEEVSRAEQVMNSLDGATEVRRLENSVIIYIREGSSAIPRIVLMMSEASITVEEVTLARPTLDDVFLQKTGHHLEVGAQAAETTEAKS
jgi:ABC-2 type transport system ATP-binding protein